MVLRSVKDESDLFSRFLENGFIIEKGEKIPKVRFFKKTFNSMNSQVILTTISSGKTDNFLNINCRKEKNQFVFMGELKKYIFFEIKDFTTRQ
jgi:hypothetical protein